MAAGIVGTGLLVQHLTQRLPDAHTDIVYSVSWSPDDTYIASASADKTVLIQEVSTGRRTITSYTGHTGAVYDAVWSPDGKRIASASFDQTVRIWEATTGNTLFTYTKHTDAVGSVAWSHSGKFIASTSTDQRLQVWEANTGNLHFTYKSGAQVLYTGSGGPDDPSNILAEAWSPDDRFLAAAPVDTDVRIWEISTGHALITYAPPFKVDPFGIIPYLVRCIAWSHNGKFLASTMNFAVQIWEPGTGHTIATYRGHTNIV